MNAVLAVLDDFKTLAYPDGSLPWFAHPAIRKADMALFKKETVGKNILGGRTTWEHDLNGRPLPGRLKHFVLTSANSIDGKGIAIHGINDALALENCVCIGGKTLYDAILPHCRRVSINVITLPDGGAPPENSITLKENILETMEKCGLVQEKETHINEYILNLLFLKP